MRFFGKQVYVEGQFVQNQIVDLDGQTIVGIYAQTTKDVGAVDAYAEYIIPGLIDLQLNGGGGYFFANAPSRKSIETIANTHLKYGTTSYLITLTTSSLENIFDGIQVVKECMAEGMSGLLGMHLEGPYLNPIKKGAHPEAWIRVPTDEELQKLIELGRDVIKVITIAPECFKPHQIAMLKEAGWVISAGHSMATYEEAQSAFSNGVTKVTHLYNAMSPFESRKPGLVGATLLSDQVWPSIIADGKHVHYASLEAAYRMLPERLFLISDASFKDEPGVEKQFGDTKVIFKDGFYYTETGRLAGSSLSMFEAVENCVKHTSIPLETAIEMASSRPLKVILGENSGVGALSRGFDADMLFLDNAFNIQNVIFKGKNIG